MFIIVPSTSAAANESGSADSRGPIRTQNACNQCRLRKAKVASSAYESLHAVELTVRTVQRITAVQ